MKKLLVKYDNPKVAEVAPLKRVWPGDAGLDLYNASDTTLTLEPGKSIMVPAGVSIKLPDDHCALLYPRSSTFTKRGIFVVPGLIDCGFTGPIYTIVWHPNLDGNDAPILIEPWERLAQLLVMPIPRFDIVSVDKLPSTPRGDSGFGSTGR